MPDIGLLQGPPRPKLVAVPAPEQVAAPEAEFVAPPPAPEPVLAIAAEREGIRVAAHTAVVSAHRPMASISAEPAAEEVARPDPVPPSPPQPAAPAPVAALPPIRVSDLFWLLLGLLILIGTGLGIRDPWPADEPRFASLARDLVTSGDWLFPRVGGDLYQDKPPVFFWMLAVCYTLFGSWKGWFLIPAFLAAGGVLFLLYDFGRRTASREAGLAAALITLCSMQFLLAFRGAQIDPVLCLLTTFTVYALLRHLLLGDGWKWYLLAGFTAGLGVITKGVGFLPLLMLIPFFALRAFRWKGLATLDAGAMGWRWWLAPVAMLAAISLWFVPMLIAASSGDPGYAAYRDEILFKQTVGRYAAAWHHVKGWYYFVAEVIPPLWLPWSILLVWLAPRFKAAFAERQARVWLPLFWVLLVLLFFSMSPGKRGVYILPALPALAIAALPFLGDVLARRGVRIVGWVLALGFFLAALVLAVGHVTGQSFAVKPLAEANLTRATPLYVYLALCGAGLVLARWRAPLAAWPVALGSLCIAFSYFIAPAMNGERSGSDFMRAALAQVKPGEQLGLVAYKEQFLLSLDRPTVNFGHRRWQEGPQEYFDAAAWLDAAPDRVLLVPEEALVPKNRFDVTQPAIPCFTAHTTSVGESSGDQWFLVRAPAESACAALGKPEKAIAYPHR